MRRSGFNIHLNTEVGRDVSFEKLRRDADAVYVATGTQLPQRMNIPGEELEGVLPGIEFLKNVKLYHSVDLTGQTVAVIGGGNTAIDSARSAVRLGAANVLLLTAPPATPCPPRHRGGGGAEKAWSGGVVNPQRTCRSKRARRPAGVVRRKMSDFDHAGRRNTTHNRGLPTSSSTWTW
jgi:NADH-quinone oxidoreductase subunit F